jgi:hypothetical protein
MEKINISEMGEYTAFDEKTGMTYLGGKGNRESLEIIAESVNLLIEKANAMEEIKEEITRFEVIDENGRVYGNYNIKTLELSYQDDGKTLKVFINN